MPSLSPKQTPENDLTILVHENDARSEAESILTPRSSSSCTDYIPSLSTSSKTILSAMGLMAGIYYYAPSNLCANREDCGLWLTNLTSHGFATGVFTTAGGLGFGIGNAYLATLSLDKLFEYIGAHPTTAGKLSAITLAALLTFTQSMPLLFASLGTDSPPLESVMAFSGGIPAALFGVVIFLQDGLPHTMANISWNTRQFYLNTLSHITKLTHEQQIAKDKANYYSAEHLRIVQQAQANMSMILKNLHVMTPESYAKITPLKYLFKNNTTYIAQHIVFRTLDKIALLAGLGLAANLSYPFLLNTLNELDRVTDGIIPSDILLGVLTVIFSVSQVYANAKLTSECTRALLDIVIKILSCRPIESVSYQSRPLLSTGVVSLTVPMAALSYASMNILTNKYYKGPYLTLFRTSAETGIDLYHLRGLYKKYETLLESFTRDQREKFLFAMEKEIENLQAMPLIKLQEHAENQTPLAVATDVYAFVETPLLVDSTEQSNGIDRADYEDIEEDVVRPNPCTNLYGYMKSLFFAVPASTATVTSAANSIQRNENSVELSNSRNRFVSQKRPLKIIEGAFPRETDSITHRYNG